MTYFDITRLTRNINTASLLILYFELLCKKIIKNSCFRDILYSRNTDASFTHVAFSSFLWVWEEKHFNFWIVKRFLCTPCGAYFEKRKLYCFRFWMYDYAVKNPRLPLKMDNMIFAFLSNFMTQYSRIYLLRHFSEKCSQIYLKTKQKRTIKI